MKKLTIVFLGLLTCASSGFASDKSYKEIISVNLERGSGSPVTETIAVELASPGEIRISNANLFDDISELSASTEVALDGDSILNPFHIEAGSSYVRELNAGPHTIEVTLKGKPGGMVSIKVLEESIVSNEVGFEILPDGTVLHKNSGLIWHRDPTTPGEEFNNISKSWVTPSTGDGPVEYIEDLNNGRFGTDPLTGNAGYSDWRIPTAKEFESLMDRRFGSPTVSDMTGSGTISSSPLYGFEGGHKYMEPFKMCDDYYSPVPDCPENGEDSFPLEAISRTVYSSAPGPITSNFNKHYIFDFWDGNVFLWGSRGTIWPVRGQMK